MDDRRVSAAVLVPCRDRGPSVFAGVGTFGDRARNFIVILLGGVLTCALSYVLLEGGNKAVRALALAGGGPEEPGRITLRRRLLLAWALGSGHPARRHR